MLLERRKLNLEVYLLSIFCDSLLITILKSNCYDIKVILLNIDIDQKRELTPSKIKSLLLDFN